MVNGANLLKQVKRLSYQISIYILDISQIPEKVITYPSASAVLYVECQIANVSMLTHGDYGNKPAKH